MNIKSIEVDGVEGTVTIARTDAGATVTANGRRICEVGRNEAREDRYLKACEAARAIYGSDRRGRPAGTNSMIHSVLNEIERVAGC